MADPKEENKETTSQNKIDYKLISLSIPEIISALHQKAISTCPSDLRIANSAIEGDGKTAKLNSAGQHIISVLNAEEGKKVSKKIALEQLKKYVSAFVGPDLANKVTDKVLMKLGSEENGNENQNQQDGKDDQEKQEDKDQQKEENADQQDEKATQEEKSDNESSDDNPQENVKKESLEIKSFQKFLIENCGMKFLFEENDEKNNEKTSSEQKEDKKDDKDSEKKDNKDDEEALGWYVAYNLKVEGLKETNLKDAMKDFATSFFDNLKLTASGLFGGSQEITGEKIRKSFHDLMHVDHEKLASNVSSYLKKKFPNIEDTSVEARDSKTLYKEIKDFISKDEKTAVNSAAYCLRIKVREEDRKKPFLNKKKIAEVIRKCMAGFRLGKKAAVTEDSIIKIEDFKDKNDPEELKNNAKRPKASEIEELLVNANEKKEKYLSNKAGIKLFNDIYGKFNSLKKDKKASEEKENKNALEILKSLEVSYSKIKAGDKYPFSIFQDFYEKYLKFEKSLGESKISFSITSRNEIVKSVLELLFEDFSQFDIEPMQVLDEKDAKENEDSSLQFDYTDLRRSIKEKAKEWISTKKTYKTTVASKSEIKKRLNNFYDDLSLVESSKYNSFAVIDFDPDSRIIEESAEQRIMNILFEDAEKENEEEIEEKDKKKNEEDKNENKLRVMIQEAFDEFKKANDIANTGKTLVLEQERMQESMKRYSLRLMLEDAKKTIDLAKLKNELEGKFKDLGSTKMANPGMHHNYTTKVGESEEIVAFVQEIGIGSTEDFDSIKSKKLAALVMIKMPKETKDKIFNGSHGNAAFTDEAVEKIYKTAIGEDVDIDMHCIEGTSTSVTYNKSKQLADVKVFVAAFDEPEEDNVNPPKPPDDDPKPPDEKQKYNVRAFLLPFDVEPEDDSPETPEEKEPEGDDGKSEGDDGKSGGNDLYVFPIASSKDFETTPEVGND